MTIDRWYCLWNCRIPSPLPSSNVARSSRDTPRCWKALHLLDYRYLSRGSFGGGATDSHRKSARGDSRQSPGHVRRFAIAAHAFPSDTDALEVHSDLTVVRLFLGRLQGVQSLTIMAFFERFIQGFMPYLAKLAAAQGSREFEYIDVHGICDVVHSAGVVPGGLTGDVPQPAERRTQISLRESSYFAR